MASADGRDCLLGVTAALSVLTTLPWLTSILLTDIFAGLAVLAVHLLVFADGTLRRSSASRLIALIAFRGRDAQRDLRGLLVALLAAAALALVVSAGSARRLGIARGMAAVALGAALLVGANYAVAGGSPGRRAGFALSFGRMLQDGIVNRYLADHCPRAAVEALRSPARAADRRRRVLLERQGSVFNNLGRFAGLGDEMSAIVTRQPARLSRAGRSRWRWLRRRIN